MIGCTGWETPSGLGDRLSTGVGMGFGGPREPLTTVEKPPGVIAEARIGHGCALRLVASPSVVMVALSDVFWLDARPLFGPSASLEGSMRSLSC